MKDCALAPCAVLHAGFRNQNFPGEIFMISGCRICPPAPSLYLLPKTQTTPDRGRPLSVSSVQR